ncbi:MAG: tetratricopeptide repeat protein [Pseudomonadota bacterium]|nr:tetratricopeptide repeat protein [Pseudomonadota bacterium]
MKKVKKTPHEKQILTNKKAVLLAIQYQNSGNVDAAKKIYQKIIESDPNEPFALHLLGIIAYQEAEYEKSVKLIKKALITQPNNAEAYSNLGAALQAIGNLRDAIDCFYKATEIAPDLAQSHVNLGAALQASGNPEKSISSCRKALNISPNDVGAHNNLGLALQDLGMLDEAIESYKKAIEIKPDFTAAGRNLLYVLLNVPGLSTEELFAEHLRFAKIQMQNINQQFNSFSNTTEPGRKLRIGYLSSDFHNHPVGLNLIPLICFHNRDKYEIYCYSNVPRQDEITDMFRSHSDYWREINGKKDLEVARLIQEDTIDILVNLAGRFDGNRPLVSAHRAAPIQVSFHDGATSGFTEMDFWLTDHYLHPPNTEELFTEKLYRLPVLYQFFPIKDAPLVGPLPAKEKGILTFGSFNNPSKINNEVISLWSEILKSYTNSRLLLKYKNLYSQVSLQEKIRNSFSQHKIDSSRIMFDVSDDKITEHLDRYNDVDITLDPFPFNGATTTYQSLFMGVPVISLVGKTFISRAAGSILSNIGQNNLAVNTPDDYIKVALKLAGNLPRLVSLRKNLRNNILASPICNAVDYTMSIEKAYQMMWQKYPKN